MKKKMIAIWNNEVTPMNLSIVGVIKASSLEIGDSLRSFSLFGGSVANAREARESIIKLIQINWIDFKGDSA